MEWWCTPRSLGGDSFLMVREEVDSRKREGLNWGFLEQDLQDFLDFQDGGTGWG